MDKYGFKLGDKVEVIKKNGPYITGSDFPKGFIGIIVDIATEDGSDEYGCYALEVPGIDGWWWHDHESIKLVKPKVLQEVYANY